MTDTRHHDLLDAAIRDMLEHGAGQLKVERVARRAGVAKGTVYLYFPTRAALVSSAIERGLIMDELATLVSIGGRGIGRAELGPLLDQAWTACEERDEVLRILARDGAGLLGDDLRARLTALVDELASTLRTDLPADLAGRSIVATLVSSYLADPSRGRLTDLRAVLGALLR